MRMSLTRTDVSFIRNIESNDFDIMNSSTCSTSKSQQCVNVEDLSAIIQDADDIKMIVPKDESKSRYFGDEKTRSCAVNFELYTI